jgi:Aspartyl protease
MYPESTPMKFSFEASKDQVIAEVQRNKEIESPKVPKEVLMVKRLDEKAQLVVEQIKTPRVREISTLPDTDRTDRGIDSKGIRTIEVRRQDQHPQLQVKTRLTSLTTGETFTVLCLIDSGCTRSCIDRDLVQHLDLDLRKLEQPIRVINADGSPNIDGPIDSVMDAGLEIKGHRERILLAITKLHGPQIFLGYDWLVKHNPAIDWKKKEIRFVRCGPDCSDPNQDAECYKDDQTHIRAYLTKSTELAIQAEAVKATAILLKF